MSEQTTKDRIKERLARLDKEAAVLRQALEILDRNGEMDALVEMLRYMR